MSRDRALVIGAGLGGLSAALVLAARGVSVEVFEADDAPGGKAGRVTVDGVTFDTGPSLFTLPEVLEKVLAIGGVAMRDVVTLRQASPAFRYRFPDGVVLDLFERVDETRASVQRTLGTDAATELDDFLSYARRIWDAAAPHFVYGDAPSFRSLLGRGLGGLLRLPAIDAMTPMVRAIRSRVRDPHLRTMLMRFATYNGSDVRRAPGTLNCIAHIELALGGYGLEGGMGTLVDVLVAQCQRLGVSLRLGTPVETIEVSRGRVRGLTTAEGRFHEAKAVICNADPALCFNRLLPPAYRPRKRQEPSMSAYNAVIRARPNPGKPRVSHEVLFPSDYINEFSDLFDQKMTPRNPAIYCCDQTITHGIQGWSDGTPLFVMVNAPPVSTENGAVQGAFDFEDGVRTRLVKAGLIAADDPVVWRRSPNDLALRFSGSQGSIYGAASNSLFSAFGRPANRVKKPRGLYLASGGAHPGGGVPLCLLSGLAAARAVIEDSHGRAEGLWVKPAV